MSKTKYYERDRDGTPSGNAHEVLIMPILLAMGFTSLETIAESQTLTIDEAPRHGITTYEKRSWPWRTSPRVWG